MKASTLFLAAWALAAAPAVAAEPAAPPLPEDPMKTATPALVDPARTAIDGAAAGTPRIDTIKRQTAAMAEGHTLTTDLATVAPTFDPAHAYQRAALLEDRLAIRSAAMEASARLEKRLSAPIPDSETDYDAELRSEMILAEVLLRDLSALKANADQTRAQRAGPAPAGPK